MGRGLARCEYAGFGIPMSESRDRFDEAARMILDALETGSIEGGGPYFPQPLQAGQGVRLLLQRRRTAQGQRARQAVRDVTGRQSLGYAGPDRAATSGSSGGDRRPRSHLFFFLMIRPPPRPPLFPSTPLSR